MIIGPFTKVSFSKYDIDSPSQIKDFLYTLNWIPDTWNYNKQTKERTSPKITLSSLESIGSTDLGKDVATYYTLRHRRNFLSNVKDPEDKGLLSKLRGDGRIGADALTCATPTGRYKHIDIVNIPKCAPKVIFGCEMREIFCVLPPYVMVGSDLSGIEARLIGHYTSLFDGGIMAQELLAGDIHTKNAALIKKDRDTAKTFFYALLYGSGAAKQASILGCSLKEAEVIIKNFFDGNPGLRDLIDYLKKFYKKHKYIRAIDKRHLQARSEHSILNLLIQASAAIIFKYWGTLIWREIDRNNWDAEIIIAMHDEYQLRVHNEIVQEVIPMLNSTLQETKEHFNLNVDLKTDSKTGQSWRATH